MSENPRALSSSLVGILLIAIFFLALLVVPRVLHKNRFTFAAPETAPSLASFPLDQPLLEVEPSPKGTKKQVTLRDFFKQGADTLLVNFWATWCPPCLEELPSLDFLNRQLQQQSKLPPSTSRLPQLVTISVDDRAADITHFYQTLDFAPSLTVLNDPQGEFARSIGTTKFPETYWITRDGKILYKWIGPQSWLSKEVLSRLSLHSS